MKHFTLLHYLYNFLFYELYKMTFKTNKVVYNYIYLYAITYDIS